MARSIFEKIADVGVVVFKQETSSEDEENKNKKDPREVNGFGFIRNDFHTEKRRDDHVIFPIVRSLQSIRQRFSIRQALLLFIISFSWLIDP